MPIKLPCYEKNEVSLRIDRKIKSSTLGEKKSYLYPLDEFGVTYGDKEAYSEYIIQTLCGFFFLFLEGERNPVEFKHVG